MLDYANFLNLYMPKNESTTKEETKPVVPPTAEAAPGQQPAPNKSTKKVEFQVNLNQFFSRGLLFVLVALLFLPFIFSLLNGSKSDRISLSQMITDIRDNKVSNLEVAGADIHVKYKDNTSKTARKEDNQAVTDILKIANVDLTTTDVKIENLSLMDMGWQVFINVLPIALMAIIFLFLFRHLTATVMRSFLTFLSLFPTRICC